MAWRRRSRQPPRTIEQRHSSGEGRALSAAFAELRVCSPSAPKAGGASGGRLYGTKINGAAWRLITARTGTWRCARRYLADLVPP